MSYDRFISLIGILTDNQIVVLSTLKYDFELFVILPVLLTVVHDICAVIQNFAIRINFKILLLT